MVDTQQMHSEALSIKRLEGSCWQDVTSMEVQTLFGTVPELETNFGVRRNDYAPCSHSRLVQPFLRFLQIPGDELVQPEIVDALRDWRRNAVEHQMFELFPFGTWSARMSSFIVVPDVWR